MAFRLHLKYGVVAEGDRLDSSADTVLVSEPSTGSKSRSKGNLYSVVTGPARSGGRGRDATALVGDTIRREYYYDESAGIPVCLEKAVRSANRRLRSGREGHHLAPGAIGAALAVVRGNELYVATIGGAEAYLVRQARLLMPEHVPGDGLPNAGEVRVDVWRGEFSVGDSLILVSPNLTEVVGTEELKNAVVTLHPQSAVEHLHHLFVAAGGDGSDAVLTIEASEVAATRMERKLVPVPTAEPPANAAATTPLALADPLGNAASAVRSGARQAGEAMGNAVSGITDRFTNLLPRRGAAYGRVTPLASRRELQRRAGIAVLALVMLLGVLGVGVWALGGAVGSDPQVAQVSSGEQALRNADERIRQVLGTGNLATADSRQAVELLRDAWRQLDQAEAAGVPQTRTAPLRDRIRGGLDALPPYNVRPVAATAVYTFPAEADPQELVRGPDGAAYVISGRDVVRIDLASGKATTVVSAGQGPGDGIGRPKMLAAAGPDVLIADTRNQLWRWRPSDEQGNGTLGQLRLGGAESWGDDVPDFGAFVIAPVDAGLYNVYAIDPSAKMIQRYRPTADGSGFASADDYLVAETDAVAGWKQMVIDGDIYVLGPEGVVRHVSGVRQAFRLAQLPDATDLRPGGTDYRLMTHVGPRGRGGRLYVWDARYGRVVAFSKEDGAFLEQFVVQGSGPAFQDIRGMYVIEAAEGQPPTLAWSTKDRLFTSVLAAAPEAPGPSASASPRPRGSAPASTPAPSATRRP